MTKISRALAVLTVSLCLFAGSFTHAEEFNWRSKENSVDVEIDKWSLKRVLENIARSSGWEVYVEPNANIKISAKFSNQPVGKALKRLIGNFSYALLPRANNQWRLLIYESNAKNATLRVSNLKMLLKDGKEGEPKRIANELVVTTGKDIDALAAQFGAQVISSKNGLHRLRFEDEAAADRALGEFETTEGVDADFNYSVPQPPAPEILPAGANVPPFSLNPSPAAPGSSLIVGLIDTGVQFEGTKIAKFMLEPIQIAGQSTPSGNGPTHGTSMAETILRGIEAASGGSDTTSTRILPVDIFGTYGETSSYDVAQGISAAIENGATIINLSLGGSGDTSYMATLMKNAEAAGIVIVGAAGNEPVATPTYPAAYPNVLAVTAADKNGKPAPYANFGAFVDAYASGTSGVNFNGDGYITSGTSTSTAKATGIIAGDAVSSGVSPAVSQGRYGRTFPFTPPPAPKAKSYFDR